MILCIVKGVTHGEKSKENYHFTRQLSINISITSFCFGCAAFSVLFLVQFYCFKLLFSVKKLR